MRGEIPRCEGRPQNACLEVASYGKSWYWYDKWPCRCRRIIMIITIIIRRRRTIMIMMTIIVIIIIIIILRIIIIISIIVLIIVIMLNLTMVILIIRSLSSLSLWAPARTGAVGRARARLWRGLAWA